MPRSDEMLTLDTLPELIRQVEEFKRQRERAKGRLDEIKARLRKQFGCKTLGEAKALLAKKHKKRMAALERYNKALVAFEKKWKHVLEKGNG